mgnify:CR=1 FL=1
MVASRFNADVTEPLLASAIATLAEHGAEAEDVYRVPGAWELPVACAALARARRHHAVLALGCLIRGETAHFDVIAHECARGLGAERTGRFGAVLAQAFTGEQGAEFGQHVFV